MGREDLFYGYNGDNIPTPKSEQDYIIAFLETAKENNKEVLITDYCWTPSYIDDSYQQNKIRNYISFAADHRELDNIPIYPDEPYNSNLDNINKLNDAKNFLYIINTALFQNKNDFLNAIKQTNYDLIIMDLFFEDILLTNYN